MNQKLTQIIRIYRLISAIENCEGIEIPYPTAQKMVQVNRELKEYLVRLEEREE